MKARGLVLAGAALVLSLVAAFAVDAKRSQWDLKVYEECARTLRAGGDPYASQPLIDNSRFQCLYPPAIIDLYRPFAALSDARDGAGERLWAALKVLALFVLLWLWREKIMARGADLPRLLFAALAYGSPFWSDFRAGNAGAFEHAVLWGALAAFVAGKDFLFAALVAASAEPKILPIALLPLVVAKPKPNWRALILGGALAAGAFGLNELLHPGLTRTFFAQLTDPNQPWRYERGPNNCATVALIQHAFETATGDRGLANARAKILSLAWTAVVAGVTGFGLRRIWSGAGSEFDKRRSSVFLYAAAYALVVPRLKDYSFLLLIPPTLAVLESDAPPAIRVGILAFALLNSTKALAEKAGLGRWALFAGYFKLYAVVLTWIALAREPFVAPRRKRS